MKKIHWILVITIIQSFAIQVLAHTKNTSLDNPTKVKAALSNVQEQIQKLEKTVYHSQNQERDLILQLASLEKAIGDHAEKVRALEEKKTIHQIALSKLHQQSAQLEKTHQTQISSLTKLIQATFRHHKKEQLQLLLEPKEVSTLARMNHYYRFFFETRAKEIKQLQVELSQIQILKQQIIDQESFTRNLAATIKQEQFELQEKKQQRQNVLVSLAKEMHGAKEMLSQFRQQEQQLEQLFKALQQKLNASPTYIEPAQDFAKMKHKLILPIAENGATLSILPNLKKSNSKKTYIGATLGTPVNAIFPGRVVFAEWLRAVGLLIIVDHGNGYLSLYGNNQKLYKGLGDWVNSGEMIARVGQSGGHAEPGLYFEIRKDGEALDPTPWFATT